MEAGGESVILPLAGQAETNGDVELTILFPSGLGNMLVCWAFLVKLESFARGLGVAATDFTTLFFPELPVAAFNSPLLKSLPGILGLD